MRVPTKMVGCLALHGAIFILLDTRGGRVTHLALTLSILSLSIPSVPSRMTTARAYFEASPPTFYERHWGRKPDQPVLGGVLKSAVSSIRSALWTERGRPITPKGLRI